MAWFWTDDLARTLVESGVIERSSVEEWVARPVAFAAADDADPSEVAMSLLDHEMPGAAGAA